MADPNDLLSAGLNVAEPVAGADLLADPHAPGPFRKGFGAGVAGVRANLAGAGALAAHAVGATGLEQSALATSQEQSDIAAAQSESASQVDWTSPAAVAKHFAFLLGNSIPSLVTMAAGGAVGRGFGAVAGGATGARLGTLAGAVAPDVALEAGGIYPEALKSNVENPAARAAVGGATAAALDFVPLLAAERYLKPVGAGGFGAVLKGAAKGAPVGAALEGSQELGQSVIERAAAGQSLTSPEAIGDYIDSFLGGAAPGSIFGGVVGAHRKSAAPVSVQPPQSYTPGGTSVAPAPTTGEAVPETGTIVPNVGTPAEQELAQHADLTSQHAAATQELARAEEAHAAAQTEQASVTARLAALKDEEKQEPGQRRIKAEIFAERKQLQARAKELKAGMEQLGGSIYTNRAFVDSLTPQIATLADQKIARRDPNYAEVPALKSPEQIQLEQENNPGGAPLNATLVPDQTPAPPVKKGPTAPLESDLLADPNAPVPVAGDPAAIAAQIEAEKQKGIVATERALRAVHQQHGMLPLPARNYAADENIVGKVAPELAVATSTSPRERVLTARAMDTAQRSAVVDHAMTVVEPISKALAEAKVQGPEKQVKKARALTAAMRGVVEEAAQQPTVEAAQAHIRQAMPAALKGHGVAMDADEIGKVVAAVTEQARTQYSRGAQKYARMDLTTAEYESGWFVETADPKNVRDMKQVAGPFKTEQEAQAALDKLAPPTESNAALTQPEFDALPSGGQARVVDTYNAIMAEKGTALRAHLRQLIGEDPNLRVKTFMANPDSPIGSYTRLDDLKSIVALAVNAKNGLSVADHEGFHYAEDQLLNASERAVVRSALEVGKPMYQRLLARVQQYDLENRTHLADEVASVPAEAHAYAFEFWRRGELQADGMLARMFEKIAAVLRSIKRFVTGQGYTSMEEVFTALDRGQFAERHELPSLKRTLQQKFGDRMDKSEYDRLLSLGADYTQTPEFKRWFGESKVVDAQGKPLVVYHGTNHPGFDKFERTDDVGFHFGTTPEQANERAVTDFDDANVMPVYLKVSDPLRLPDLHGWEPREVAVALEEAGVITPEQADDVIENGVEVGREWVRDRLAKKGYDGIVYENRTEGSGDSYIVFSPEQIKSALGNTGAFDPNNPDIRFSQGAVDSTDSGLGHVLNALTPRERTLYSQAAVAATAQMTRASAEGGLQANQHFVAASRMIEDAMEHGSEHQAKVLFGALNTEVSGGLSRWLQKNILTPNFVSHLSAGYKNVFTTLNTYIRYRNDLVERMLIQKIPQWYSASNVDQNAAFDALLKRTTERYTAGSPEYNALLAGLTEQQRGMFASATGMISDLLDKEFEVDRAFHQQVLVTPGEYEKWLANRTDQIRDLKEYGYVPLRRYGDHTVHVYMDATGADGRAQKLSGALQFFQSAATAHAVARIYEEEIARSGATWRVEIGTHYKAARDTTISAQQFLDTARRNGVALTALEKERLVKALTSADSLTRNRMLHREGLPGYSKDGMRVLNEFGMNTAGKIAYSVFAPAIDAASEGRAVQSDVLAGQPQIAIDMPAEGESAAEYKARSLWAQEGPMSGFHHNLADELTDYVLVPDHTGGWSKKLRGAAMAYFIGGSISSGLVNVMSVPMMVVPQLAVHTDYGTAAAMTLGAWKTTWQYQHILRDIERLKDVANNPIPDVDAVPGLRGALIEAQQYTMDTELHQIMGISQGALFSQNQSVQRAMKAWMAPFRVSEQTNRITSFIAGYKVGQKNGLTGPALFQFARETIDATQNNYNQANRPGAARNPITALLFMFKSFPLFMTEAATLMYRANPKAAVYMLLGLTAMTGVQGLPFAETIEDLIDTIAQNVFGSPFNARRAMRNVIKSASEAFTGYDASELVLRGAVNSVLGMSVSSRIGAGDFVPGSRLGTADADQGRVLEQLLGAPYAMIKDGITATPAALSAAASGDWKGVADALRAGGPVALRNVIKGVEQAQNGFASDAKGRKIIDVTGLDAMLQMAGVSSAGLAKAYEFEKINLQTKAFYTQVSAEMQQKLVQAVKAGDTEAVQHINDLRAAWNAQYPEMPIMASSSAVRRELMLSGQPLDRRSMLLWSRRIRGANVFSEPSAD